MTYNVFGGTLNLTQSINKNPRFVEQLLPIRNRNTFCSISLFMRCNIFCRQSGLMAPLHIADFSVHVTVRQVIQHSKSPWSLYRLLNTTALAECITSAMCGQIVEKQRMLHC